MHPNIFVLRANKPQPQQECAECKRRIIPDGRFTELRILLINALRGNRHSQNNVGFDLARMEG